jgi:hypothetical protein
MTGIRRVAAVVVALAWLAALGVAWLVYLGNRLPPCRLAGVGSGDPAIEATRIAALESCNAAWLAANPAPPLFDWQLTWLVMLAVGFAVIWSVARPARR